MTTSIKRAEYGELSERAQHLLKLLVERYIYGGQPVGSRSLARQAGMDLSPATIRNVMSDLEEMGLLASPHTSAGRVPTALGYRFFIDSLLQVKPPLMREVEELRRTLDPEMSTTDLVQSVSDLLSKLTHMAAVVTLPRLERMVLRHVEFLALSENRVLAILVVNEREVQNRVIHLDRQYSEIELQQAANCLNQEFAGRDIHDIRFGLLREMQRTRETMNSLMDAVVKMASMVFQEDATPQDDYVLAGQTNLMEFAELSDMEKLRQLFEAFNRKRDILHLLDQCIHGRGVQIFIGEESGYSALGDCSVVTAPYTIDGKVLGVLGVIGPTRMAYERVIPMVDVTAKLLAAALNSRN